MRRSRCSLIALLAIACSDSTGPSPDGRFVGTWIGEQVGLQASAEHVFLAVPCMVAGFAPIIPSADGSFELVGKIVSSPKAFSNNRPARLSGRLTGDTLRVEYALNLDGEWPEPTTRVVTMNNDANFIVLNASCIT